MGNPITKTEAVTNVPSAGMTQGEMPQLARSVGCMPQKNGAPPSERNHP